MAAAWEAVRRIGGPRQAETGYASARGTGTAVTRPKSTASNIIHTEYRYASLTHQ